MFYVGQKVVCVDDNFPEEYFNQDGATQYLPVKDIVYTVRDSFIWVFGSEIEPLPAILLDEIINSKGYFFLK